MRFFQLTEIETGIAQSQIGKIILDRCVDILLALNIIADSTINQERIAKIVNISFDDRVADGLLLDTFASLCPTVSI